MKRSTFFCSWSGGKDCSLALYHVLQNGGRVKSLLTMMTEGGERTRSHGLPIDVIQRQSVALGIQLNARKASWADYEEVFLRTLYKYKQEGIDCGVFGDIDLDPHLEWVEEVCSLNGIIAYEPLWKRSRHELLEEFLQLGFLATIVAIKEDVLNPGFLGRRLDKKIIRELKDAGIDPSGEEGEYHTVVTDGPIFSSPIQLESRGQVTRNGYRFLDVAVMV